MIDVKNNQRHLSLSRILLFALVLFAVQTATAMHELEHDLLQHDKASCALHLFADQANGVAGDAQPTLPTYAVEAIVSFDDSLSFSRQPSRVNAPRAPPLSV